jgi:hypothetical protein
MPAFFAKAYCLTLESAVIAMISGIQKSSANLSTVH